MWLVALRSKWKPGLQYSNKLLFYFGRDCLDDRTILVMLIVAYIIKAPVSLCGCLGRRQTWVERPLRSIVCILLLTLLLAFPVGVLTFSSWYCYRYLAVAYILINDAKFSGCNADKKRVDFVMYGS